MYIPPQEQKEFKLIPEGVHTAVLYSIVDLGSQYSEMYQKASPKVRLTWELSEELMKDGRPMVIGSEYTVSANAKSQLSKMIKSWIGQDISQGFDLNLLVGEACNVSVAHTSSGSPPKTYANIVAITALKKSEKKPKQINPTMIFELDNYTNTAFETLPEFMREKIKKSPEYAEAIKPEDQKIPAIAETMADDQIPF